MDCDVSPPAAVATHSIRPGLFRGFDLVNTAQKPYPVLPEVAGPTTVEEAYEATLRQLGRSQCISCPAILNLQLSRGARWAV